MGEDAYIDYNHRYPEHKDLSFEERVSDCDAIYCDIVEMPEDFYFYQAEVKKKENGKWSEG